MGLYLWGGVGRGKSFLMDMFYACVPYKRKRRIHFHNFMSEAHHEMKLLAHEKDPLIALADRIEKSTRLLCFDEFHVTDIADAMILARLLQAMFERGVVMIMTSNSAPDDLYANGLQRQKFLPAIALIKQHLRVIRIDSGNDYRLRAIATAPLYMLSEDADSESRMQAIFQRLSGETGVGHASLQIAGRIIPLRLLSKSVAWFDFDNICGGPRAQEDYLEIARKFPVVMISGIPQMGATHAAAAQRLIWLVDILYDNRVKLVVQSAVAVEALCTDPAKSFEFARTISRLTEMQSQDYLKLPHQTELATLTH